MTEQTATREHKMTSHAMIAHAAPGLRRRQILGLAMGGLVATAAWQPGMADAPNATPQAPVAQLNDALLAAMKAGDRMSFQQRYRMLDPVIGQTFNLDAVLAASVGLRFASMQAADKAQLATAFRRYTVSSYVSNFNSYNGQSFEILPDVRHVGGNEVVVSTRLLRRDDSPVKLDYVVRRGPDGWQIVDVLTNGSISRVAVQRSDFVQLLSGGGAPALTVALDRKVANLSGGMVG